jgi:hypothetical protein
VLRCGKVCIGSCVVGQYLEQSRKGRGLILYYLEVRSRTLKLELGTHLDVVERKRSGPVDGRSTNCDVDDHVSSCGTSRSSWINQGLRGDPIFESKIVRSTWIEHIHEGFPRPRECQ